jgi:L-cysteine S-thiosulfotransferase
MERHWIVPALAACAAASLSTSTAAQQKSAADGIAEYRKMLEDGNPAELFEAKGEKLWKTRRGPKNASLEQCDLGKGTGKVRGAFVELPRWFADAERVQDLESRLLTCIENLQGIAAADITKTPFGRGEQSNMEALVAWIAAESRGLRFNLPQGHADEKCHSEDGKRVRLQDLDALIAKVRGPYEAKLAQQLAVTEGLLYRLICDARRSTR